jgi:CRISPR-associated protein Cas1
MSWRIVVISSRAKLDLKMNYLVVRGEEIRRIHLSEISTIMIENTAVSLTAALLCELTRRKIKVIFCDEKRNPSSELLPYYGSHDTSGKIRQQIQWRKETKRLVWMEIVTEKIRQQAEFLRWLHRDEAYELLRGYMAEMEPGDETNREGHAAKVYFNGVFGMDFTRSSENSINAALNYGYGILLSTFNREIVTQGYVTQLGLFHDNQFNQFNLGSDLMEPFRPLIDRAVYDLSPEVFTHDEKMAIVNVLNQKVEIDGKQQYLNYAVKIYCRSIFDALAENDVGLIRFYTNGL